MLVWANPAVNLHEEAEEEQLYQTHHSRAAGLSQRLAAGEKKKVESAHHVNHRKQKENGTHCDIEPATRQGAKYLRSANRALCKALLKQRVTRHLDFAWLN